METTPPIMTTSVLVVPPNAPRGRASPASLNRSLKQSSPQKEELICRSSVEGKDAPVAPQSRSIRRPRPASLSRSMKPYLPQNQWVHCSVQDATSQKDGEPKDVFHDTSAAGPLNYASAELSQQAAGTSNYAALQCACRRATRKSMSVPRFKASLQAIPEEASVIQTTRPLNVEEQSCMRRHLLFMKGCWRLCSSNGDRPISTWLTRLCITSTEILDYDGNIASSKLRGDTLYLEGGRLHLDENAVLHRYGKSGTHVCFTRDEQHCNLHSPLNMPCEEF